MLRFQFTQLFNQNIDIAVVGDEHPGAEVKAKLAQFQVGQVVCFAGTEWVIEDVSLRPCEGYGRAYVEWHIHYSGRSLDDLQRVASFSETELLLANPQPNPILALCLIYDLYVKSGQALLSKPTA